MKKLALAITLSLSLSACSESANETAPVSSFSWDVISNVPVDYLGFDTISECLAQLEGVDNKSICHIKADKNKFEKGYVLSISSIAKGRTVGLSNYENLEKCKKVEISFNRNSNTHIGECVEFQMHRED